MSNFKVIVIGGGPVGLTTAHALSKANIDYVVLEARPQIAEDVGASLVIFPPNLRVFSQFGLFGKLRESESAHEVMRWAEFAGPRLTNLYWPSEISQKNYGQSALMFHRAELIRVIYDGLKKEDKERIHLNKRMTGVEATANGVVVTCADGSSYEGSIILGADGVHSKTRGFLREQALKADPDADVDGEHPFPVEYKTMWYSIPRRYEFTPGDHYVNHGNGASLQLLNSNKRAWMFVYEKLDKPHTGGRVKYTEADMAAFSAKHGEMMIGNRLKLRDLFEHRMGGGMANLEEGVLKHWSHGRIVLAGDACHKFTPNAGFGLNNGIQDVVALTNELHWLIEASPNPSQDELTAVFKKYQDSRHQFVQSDLDLAAHTTRLCAWPNSVYWFVDQWVMPYIPFLNDLMAEYVMAPKWARAQCLDFVESEEPFEGRVRWQNRVPKPTARVNGI